MACDTFLKIAQKCKRKFVTQQPAEPRPFVQDLVAQLPQIISDLEPHQVHAFYEATATLLSDRGGHPSVGQQRPELLRRLMTLPNDAWARVTADAARDPSTLTRPETVRDVTKIVRTHARVCASCGPLYVTQLGGIYMDLLNVCSRRLLFSMRVVSRPRELVRHLPLRVDGVLMRWSRRPPVRHGRASAMMKARERERVGTRVRRRRGAIAGLPRLLPFDFRGYCRSWRPGHETSRRPEHARGEARNP